MQVIFDLQVQNWKTDSTFNASADADSGFRGSELETRTNPKKGSSSSRKKSPCLEEDGRSPKQEHTLQTVGTSTEEDQLPPVQCLQPKIKSQSYNDINYTFSSASNRSGSHDRSLDKVHHHLHHHRFSTDHFKTLDPLLDEATAMARRVQKKSRRLAKMIQSVDKKV
jgi:hypothetical protein